MNDNNHTPEPTDAVEARLRRTLHAVADATPVEDRRGALLTALDAIDESEPPAPPEEDAMHLDARTDPARPLWRRPLFLAAAAALVVVAVIGAVLAGGDDGAVELPPAEDGDVPATGWYLPPEGWEVTEVRADFVDVDEQGECPCRSLVAAGVGQDPPAMVVWESGDISEEYAEEMQGEPVDVGGRPGQLVDLGLPSVLVGTDAGFVWVAGSRVEVSDLVDVADAWLDRLDAGEDVDPSALPLPDGVHASPVVASPALRSAHVVDVTAVETDTGRRAYYQLAPASSNLGMALLDSAFVERAGREFAYTSTVGVTPFAGRAGGPLAIAVGPSFFAEEGDLAPDELRPFLDGLRPASALDWHEATADVPVEPEVAAAETLFGPPLVDGPVDG